MARVVMFGLGPMRWEQSTRLFALPLRTWHFAATLARDRHEVVLFSMRTAAFEGWPADKVTKIERDGVTVYSLSEHLIHERPDWIAARIRELVPDCVVGVNKDPAAVAANFAGELPFWADVNGDPMAEAQAKAEVEGTDVWTKEFYRRFVPVLMRADRFSTCSGPQRAALIGQLSMVGRLTGANAAADLVHAIPNSVDDAELALLGRIERAPRAPDDPFVLLWSGGYNTWADPDLLFDVVDGAMSAEPALRFVSTGGAIGGHYTRGYERFQERIAGSRHADRYHLAGWVQTAELPAYYADADAAILTDRFGYEGVLGARTRMLDWLAAGLPIVSTRLSEISREIEKRGAGLCSPCGEADEMIQNVLTLARQPELAVLMGERGRAYARQELRADLQLAALRDWVADPRRAPDGERRIDLPSHEAALGGLRSLARQLAHRSQRDGLRGSLGDARRFALRRARHGVQRVLDQAGLPGGVRVIELNTPQAPPHEPPRAGALQWRRRLSNGSGGPRVAVVVLVGPGDDAHVLEWTLVQVERQYFERWELIVAVQPGAPAGVAAKLPESAHLVDTLQANPFEHRAVRDADYVALVGVGDLLRPDALAELVTAAVEREVGLVYGDEQDVDETNAPRPVVHKPDWSPEELLVRPYLGRCAIYTTRLVDIDPARAREWPVEALAYDLSLRATDGPIEVHRVPRVLSQRFVRVGSGGVPRAQRASELQLRALADAVWRRGLDAEVERGPEAGTFRLRYPIPDDVSLTLVVPYAGTDGGVDRCIDALRARSRFQGLRVVLGALPDGSAREGAAVARELDRRIRASESELVGWLSGEAEVVTDGWAEELVRHAMRDGVGAVAPKILEPSGRLAWPRSGPAAHVHEVSALPLQCAVMERRTYLDAGGLPDAPLRRAVDALTSAIRAGGERLLYTPHSALYLPGGSPRPVASGSGPARDG